MPTKTRRRLTNKVLSDFQKAGICTIDVPQVVANWNHNACIHQKDNQFNLIQYHRRATNFTKTSLHVQITKDQAYEIIDTLGLCQRKDALFVRHSFWRRPEGEPKV